LILESAGPAVVSHAPTHGGSVGGGNTPTPPTLSSFSRLVPSPACARCNDPPLPPSFSRPP